MSVSKYRRIANELRSDIAAGKFYPTGKLPSETQLVRQYEVSRPTAARALKELEDQGLIERRTGSGSFLRHKTASVADGQQVIGMLAPDISSTEILEVICGDLARLARLHDYAVLWGNEREESNDPERAEDRKDQNARAAEVDAAEAARQACDQFIKRDVQGVFFAPFENHDDSASLNLSITKSLRQAGISVILLDRDITPFPSRSEFDLVGIDNFGAGFKAAAHLLRMKCKRLLFLAPPRIAPTVCQRISGAREAVLQQNSEHHSVESSLNVVYVEPDQTEQVSDLVRCFSSRTRSRTLSQQKNASAATTNAKGKASIDDIDAIICSNDRVAATLMQTLARLKISIPSDIRLIGFDDVTYAQLLTTPLTTIRQPCRDIAVVAFRAMADSIEKVVVPPRQYLLPAELIVRESCGTYL
ncbi:GntR family transcriptional regulator [Mariniblastus fucicola]|uniref:Arabinose metabolism transcriptional repressor n=1 Tax=Mariniblastus fucicola TaxID=980251 RepID=A0A5B9PKE4_9BACT|nr:GntR family transcriptional regulator [Mariniblastus fucicola]QEG25166.1 Arabinose metabolism transcriptional repressor [Mariniblastus fucicola]